MLAPGKDLPLAVRDKEAGAVQVINIALAGEGPDVDRSGFYFLVDEDHTPSIVLPMGLTGTYGATRFHSRFVSCSSSVGRLGCTVTMRMPYRHALRGFFHNGGRHPLTLWGWMQGETLHTSVPTEELHSVSGGDQYEGQIMVHPYQEITLLDVDGPGRLAGLQFFMDRHNDRPNSNENCVEGNFRYYIDGTDNPQYESSGTEDYFGSSFNFQDAPYASDSFGVFYNRYAGVSGPGAADDQVSAWRWHHDDSIHFDHHLRVTWQCGDRGGPEIPVSPAGIAWTAYYYRSAPTH
ncbi:DUF2961 domain-containing protein [Asaia krungthepensis]|uniref:Uncharacterized protein n=1 Tax=Asaia krungthepensis NRIC 0535 TaxID=1307925 RepID=A0ABQ0Q0B9_9PROT|nr:DUF2961 domain-containing protein [Asaia krungthepensis]GBQ86002.1 hypothetical protein AA0535_0914 [Asaia krungthepensis NRIC 0535]